MNKHLNIRKSLIQTKLWSGYVERRVPSDKQRLFLSSFIPDQRARALSKVVLWWNFRFFLLNQAEDPGLHTARAAPQANFSFLREGHFCNKKYCTSMFRIFGSLMLYFCPPWLYLWLTLSLWFGLTLTHSGSLWLSLAPSVPLFLALSDAHQLTRSLLGSLRRNWHQFIKPWSGGGEGWYWWW